MPVSLARRLICFLDVFSTRPDVFVVRNSRNRPALGKRLPRELAVFAQELGGVEFTWTFAADKDQRDEHIAGYNGGRLEIPRISRLTWYPRPSHLSDEDFAFRALLDNMVNEGLGWWIYRENESYEDAVTAFENANDCTLTRLGSLEAYLTRGARRAFVWYWQADDREGEAFLKRLRAASIPANTPAAEIDRRLAAAGVSSEEAAALRAWLGKDVTLLLHRDGNRTPNISPKELRERARNEKVTALLQKVAEESASRKTARAARKTSAEKPPTSKASAKKAPAKKTSAKKTSAKKAPAKKATAKKAPAKKTSAKKTAVKKTAAKKTAAKKPAAKKSTRRTAR